MEIREEFLPYARPYLQQNEVDEVVDAMNSNWLSKGPKTTEFEKDFADYVGVKYAIGLNSCTAALHLGLLCAGIEPGDEVITTPFTFCATANTIEHVGAKPIFVDIDPVTYCIDPNKIEDKITSRTKAIVPVHYGGHACDMDAIMKIAKKYGLFVLEDAAHAVYTEYKGKKIGSIGDMTAFSFYATKNLCTGEGGMLTTNNDEIATKARIMSLHGMSRNAWNRYGKGGSWYYEVEYPGYKYNMTDIQASMGIHQLKKIDSMQRIREQYASMYSNSFQKMNEIIEPKVLEYTKHAWHLYVIGIRADLLSIDRNQFIEELVHRNIGVSVHFIPLHLQPYYQKKYEFKEGDFPICEEIYRRSISLPLYPSMKIADVEYVIRAVKDIIDQYKIV